MRIGAACGLLVVTIFFLVSNPFGAAPGAQPAGDDLAEGQAIAKEMKRVMAGIEAGTATAADLPLDALGQYGFRAMSPHLYPDLKDLPPEQVREVLLAEGREMRRSKPLKDWETAWVLRIEADLTSQLAMKSDRATKAGAARAHIDAFAAACAIAQSDSPSRDYVVVKVAILESAGKAVAESAEAFGELKGMKECWSAMEAVVSEEKWRPKLLQAIMGRSRVDGTLTAADRDALREILETDSKAARLQMLMALQMLGASFGNSQGTKQFATDWLEVMQQWRLAGSSPDAAPDAKHNKAETETILQLERMLTSQSTGMAQEMTGVGMPILMDPQGQSK